MADFNDCPCWRCREPEGKAARAEMIAEIVDGEYAAHHHVTRELPLVPLDASGQLFRSRAVAAASCASLHEARHDTKPAMGCMG